ncbi:MAG: hypothetical protein R3B06_30900 [Kofleriaceae bacterium]
MARLRVAPPAQPRDGWEQRLAARYASAQATRARRRWGFAVGGLALAAAAAALLLVWRHDDRVGAPPPMTVAIRATDGVARRGAAAVGDTLAVTAGIRAGQLELRVYAGAVLAGRCPGSAACTTQAGALTLTTPLVTAGRYTIVAVRSAQAIPPPLPGGLDADLLQARSAGATIEQAPPVDVSP